jgi:CheY-like chemotaxis protein
MQGIVCMPVVDDSGVVGRLREALLHLYDPTVLAELPLAVQLTERGVLRSPSGLYDLLLELIERLKPPGTAPSQSHGWRCYRYLSLRYVECISHEIIAEGLGLSSRQAYRVHSEAIEALAALLPTGTGATPAERIDKQKTRAQVAENPGHAGRTRIGIPPKDELAAVGRQPPEGAVEVADVLESIHTTLSGILVRQGVRLHVDLPEDLPPVKVNRVCLRQVLLNLALFLVESIRDSTITVRGECLGDTVMVSISCDADAVEVRQAARPDSEDNLPPLEAARHLAQLQGIALEELDTRPRAFLLRLPVGRVRTILLIDDNPDIGNLFRRMLGKDSYRLVHCRTADRALHLARESLPDVIILDVVMPTQDGWELLSAVRKDARIGAIPVVVCSVLADRALALSLDATDFISKPVSRDTLLATLDRIIAAPGVSSVRR